jgi:glycosyltransferase involved in cell wall biosynthesis
VTRLLVLTPSELTRDPRARRQVWAARELGLAIIGLSGRASGEEPAPFDSARVVRAGRPGRFDPLREAGLGAGSRERPLVRELRGFYRLARLVSRTLELVAAGRTLPRADVVHANDFDTLPAGWLLARRWRARLVYDAHELYSSFEVDPPRLYRLVAGALERIAARRASVVVTVSEPIAAELARRLRLPRPPLVVLNLPELDEAEPAVTLGEGPLRAIYQGSFGTGRPLSELLEAVRLAPSVELVIRAVRADRRTLEREVRERGLADRVAVVDTVPPDRAVEGLRDHDVGVIFDRPVTLNGRLSLPNKLFEYLMAGLAVVVPCLPALAPLVERDQIGVLFDPGDSGALARALEELAADRERLAELRSRARAAAVARYNAQAQLPALAQAWGVG